MTQSTGLCESQTDGGGLQKSLKDMRESANAHQGTPCVAMGAATDRSHLAVVNGEQEEARNSNWVLQLDTLRAVLPVWVSSVFEGSASV